MNNHEILFYGKDLGQLIRAYEAEVMKEVEGWDKNKVLAASEPDLIAYLVEKYTLDPPRILKDQVHVADEGECQIDVSHRFEYDNWGRPGPHLVPGQYVTIAIPFEGDGGLFGFRASSYTTGAVRGRVAGQVVQITFRDVELKAEQVRQEIDNTVREIERYLEWTVNDCSAWNQRLPTIATQCLHHRKTRLLQQSNMVSALGLPMKRRPESAANIAVPVARKKRPLVVPPTPKAAFKPEWALPDAEYDYVLEIVGRLSLTMERSPSTFANMHEEQIRDLILVNLNGHYEGDATGETFNAQGKTDILIRADGKNAFIAECKFWEGPKTLTAAIDQILGYLTWRDTKAALLVFSKNVDFSKVLEGIAATVPQHPSYKRELKRVSDTHVRYLFSQPGDPDRDLYLAVLAFNVPKQAE